jgi:hypothetical protein
MKQKLGALAINLELNGDFKQVSHRTDEKMRLILEFCLQAAIVSDNDQMLHHVLTFGI